MNFDVKLWFYIIIAILFLGFFVLSVLAVRSIIKQKEIRIISRLRRQSGLIEVLNVNIALLVIVFLVIKRLYLYIPLMAVFAFFIMTTTRLKSGIADEGIFIGMTFIPWDKIKAYKVINDDINTLQLRFRVENRQYIMRCNKEERADIAAILRLHHIPEIKHRPKSKESS